MTTKKRKKNGKTGDASDGVMVKRLDGILEALKTLLILQGYDAGITKSKVRAMVKVADGRVSKVWKELEAARKVKEKAAKKTNE